MSLIPLTTTPPRTFLREAGLRATTNRIAVFQALREGNRPMHHAEVAQSITGVAMNHSTVFRALSDMTEAGLLWRLELGDHVWRYELAVSRNGTEPVRHPHFVCIDCGQIRCLEGALEFRKLDRVVKGVGAVTDVFLKGRCLACLNNHASLPRATKGKQECSHPGICGRGGR